MKDVRFRVIFTGHLTPGMTVRQVRANLEKFSQFKPQALDRIFAGRTEMRSGVNRKAAWRCWELFRRAGALCTVEPMEPNPSSYTATSCCGTGSNVTCPCCLNPQETQTICRFCGVDIAIYNLTANLYA